MDTFPEITVFAKRADGTRMRAFDVDGCTITVTPRDDDEGEDERAAQLALELATVGTNISVRWVKLFDERNEAVTRVAALQIENALIASKIPPPTPARMAGTACVRFDEQGRLWLLNRGDRGWAEFGIRLDGWDDLFRRYAVRVTSHGIDQHGTYWIIAPDDTSG